MRPRGLVVAVDGPSGAGKSTAGRELARRLGYVFIDTGAMYRAVALKALRQGVALDDAQRLAELGRVMTLEFSDGGRGVKLDDEDVSAELRSREVSAASSQVSRHSLVRRTLVERQRELGRAGGVVLDGRDIGTAVFPDAELKFFLDADPKRRAQRRFGELVGRGAQAELAAIERETIERDHADSTRGDSPLRRAPDAVLVDSTDLEPDEVVDRMEAEARARSAEATSHH